MDRYIKYIDINVVEYIYEHYKYLRDNLKIEDGTDGKIKFDEIVYEYCSDDRNIELMSFEEFLLPQGCVVNEDELKLLALKNGDKKFVLTAIIYRAYS